MEPVNGLSARTLVACRDVKDALPDPLPQGLDRGDASPASDTTSVFGDPPVTIRCGVAEGSPRDDPYVFNGVTWAMHDSGASRTWTTRGRPVQLEVVVPDAYSSQAEIVGAVSKALVAAAR